MRAAVLTEIGRLEVASVPDPVCGDNEVILRVEVCAICGTDLKFFTYGHRKLSPPLVLGHEIVGVAEEVGDAVAGVDVGARYALSPSGTGCGTCFFCQAGKDELCGRYRGLAGKGGFAERVLVPEAMVRAGNLHRVPDHVEPLTAALTEPLACVLNSYDHLDAGPGRPAVVLGAGPIGVLVTALLAADDSRPLFVTDIDEQRLRRVPAAFGAEVLVSGQDDVLARVRDATDGLGPAIVVVAAPTPAAQQEALRLVRKTGTVCFFAGLPRGTLSVEIDTNRIHYDQITVFGTSNCGVDHSRRALELLADGVIAGDAVISHTFPLEEAVEAFRFAGSREGLKVAIVP